MAVAGSLIAEMGMNIARLQQDVGKATNVFSSFTKNVESMFKNLGTTIAGAISVGSLGALGKEALQLGDDLSKASKKFGIGVEDLSALRFAATLADVDFQDLGTAFKKLSVNMAGASTGTSDAALAFKALGINVKDVSGNVIPTDRMFAQLSDRFEGMKDGAEKTALAVALFGKSGANIIPILNEGSAGLKKMADDAGKLGAVMSTEQAKNLEEYNDNLKKIKMTATGLAATLINTLGGAVSKLGESFGRSLAGEGAQALGTMQGKLSDILGPNPDAKKIAAPNIAALKAAMEERKKLEEEYGKMHAKNVAAEGKIVHDALAAEMGYDKEYFETRTKMGMDDFKEWKRIEDEKVKYMEELRGTMDALGVPDMEAELADAMPALDAMVSKMKSMTPMQLKQEDFGAMFNAGNAQGAIGVWNDGLGEQIRLLDEDQGRIRLYTDAWNLANTTTKGYMNQIGDAGLKSLDRLGDTLTQFVMTGKAKFADFANFAVSSLMRIAIQASVIQPLTGMVLGAFGPAVATPSVNLSGGNYSLGGNYSFGGGKASGGPVYAGVAYDVGERGPEKFIPSVAGTIVPNGGGAQNFKVEIINQSGQPVTAKQSSARFDGQEYVVSVWLDALQRNRFGLRNAIGGA